MRLLTTNLLNLTRRDDGIKPEIETLDSSFFDKVFTNYATIAEESEKGFTAQNQVGRSIKTDKTLMKQLMTILFDNAIKYTPKNSHIVIRTEKRGKQAIVSISDDGNGIADEIKPRIFDMFYSGANQIADSRRSLGLGLSLCKSIINAHGGELTVSDNLPHGTVFTFTLPAGEVKVYE